jgi:hypothetical protein
MRDSGVPCQGPRSFTKEGNLSVGSRARRRPDGPIGASGGQTIGLLCIWNRTGVGSLVEAAAAGGGGGGGGGGALLRSLDFD